MMCLFGGVLEYNHMCLKSFEQVRVCLFTFPSDLVWYVKYLNKENTFQTVFTFQGGAILSVLRFI